MARQHERVTAEKSKPKVHDSMLNRLLFLSALGFFILGYKTGDGLVFYFFSIHLLVLAIGRFFRKRETKLSGRAHIKPLSEIKPAQS